MNNFVLYFRLASFILPSYLVFSSVYYNDVKAYLYLLGLMVASVLAGLLVSGFLFKSGELSNQNAICNLFTINGISSNNMSWSTMILSFSIAYLYYCMKKINATSEYIHVLVALAIVLLADTALNIYTGCIIFGNHLITVGSLALFGYIWGYCVDQLKIKNSLFFDHPSNREKCKPGSGKKYRCAHFKKGKQVTFNTSVQ